VLIVLLSFLQLLERPFYALERLKALPGGGVDWLR
jgi:hypothetical protein